MRRDACVCVYVSRSVLHVHKCAGMRGSVRVILMQVFGLAYGSTIGLHAPHNTPKLLHSSL